MDDVGAGGEQELFWSSADLCKLKDNWRETNHCIGSTMFNCHCHLLPDMYSFEKERVIET